MQHASCLQMISLREASSITYSMDTEWIYSPTTGFSDWDWSSLTLAGTCCRRCAYIRYEGSHNTLLSWWKVVQSSLKWTLLVSLARYAAGMLYWSQWCDHLASNPLSLESPHNTTRHVGFGMTWMRSAHFYSRGWKKYLGNVARSLPEGCKFYYSSSGIYNMTPWKVLIYFRTRFGTSSVKHYPLGLHLFLWYLKHYVYVVYYCISEESPLYVLTEWSCYIQLYCTMTFVNYTMTLIQLSSQ